MPVKPDAVKKMKVFPKGQVVIPVALRKQYQIEIGDHIEVIPSRDGILLKPVAKSENTGLLTDRLFGVFKEYADTKEAAQEDIDEATETGFIEGWKA